MLFKNMCNWLRTQTWSLCVCIGTCCCSSAPHRWCRCSEKGSHRHSRSVGGAARKAGPLRTGSWAQAALTGSANKSAEGGKVSDPADEQRKVRTGRGPPPPPTEQ